MSEKRYFSSIPAIFFDKWKNCRGKLSYYHKTEYAQKHGFLFSLADDIEGEKFDSYDFLNAEFVEFYIDALYGRIKYDRKSVFSSWAVYLYFFTQETLHRDTFIDYTKGDKEGDRRIDYLEDYILKKAYEKGDLTTSIARLAFKNLMHDAEYISDLSMCLLKAPDGKGFVIGDYPVLFFNPFQTGRETEFVDYFDSYGLITSVPISSCYALCFYDDFVYKARKVNGIVQLDRDDIDRFNSVSIHQSKSILYDSDVTTQRNLDLLYGVRDSSIVNTVNGETYYKLELSPFSIRARAEEDVIEKGYIPKRRYSAVQKYSDVEDRAQHDKILEEYLVRYDNCP